MSTKYDLTQQVRFNRILLAISVVLLSYLVFIQTGSKEALTLMVGIGMICAVLWGRLMWDEFVPVGGDE